MRLVAQGVQKQHVQAPQHLHGTFRNLAVIGQVRRLAEAEAVDFLLSVQDRHRQEFQAEQVERGAVQKALLQLGDIGVALGAVENVRETAVDVLHGVRRGVNRNRPFCRKLNGRTSSSPIRWSA